MNGGNKTGERRQYLLGLSAQITKKEDAVLKKKAKQLLAVAVAYAAMASLAGCTAKETAGTTAAAEGQTTVQTSEAAKTQETSAAKKEEKAKEVPKGNKGGVPEHIQSFEGGVPDNWSAVSGNLEISDKHYKHEKTSLKWQWESGGSLLAINEVNMDVASETEHGGLIAWVYNETPIKDKLTVNLGTQSQITEGNPAYTFDYYLDFEGWRALWIDFKKDAVNPEFKGEQPVTIEQMEIVSPENVKQGELYLDLVEFVNNLHWCRAQDYQIPIQRANSNGGLGGTWERGYYYIKQKPRTELTPLTEEELADIKTIEKRFDEWVYGTGRYSGQGPMEMRKEALDAYIKEGLEDYETLEIKRHEDGSITGVPLFASRSPYIKMGKQFGSEVSTEIFLPLVFDYKLNQNMESFDKLMTLFDYYHDQGWAEGSGLGTPDHETNRSSGYFVAVYLMREELKETGRFDREIGAMNWYTDFGKVYGEYKVDYTETTADEMRTHFLYRLLYAMAMEDTPEKVQAINAYREWVESALELNPNFAGTIKPDYTGFHHRGIYVSAYAPHGYHMAAVINYLLHDTVFELDQTSQENLKGALEAVDVMTKDYNLPQSLTGRFPKQTGIVSEILPAYAYMALSGDPVTGDEIDKDMAGIFMRLWNPDSSALKKRFNKCRAGISYIDTIGGLELVFDLLDQGLPAGEEPQGFFTMPYGGMVIHRRDDWMVNQKGWSQYVWDYESGGTKKENVYGRYCSYGALQIMSESTPAENGITVQDGWDWNRVPGATTKYLPFDLLSSEVNDYAHRSFSDQTFLGGVSSQGQNGMFSMQLHDTQYDPSFYANKSSFFFDDEIICLGSGIQNADKDHETETTLFQSGLNGDTAMPFYLNSTEPIEEYPYEKTFTQGETVWMMDPYGNGYYIPKAEGIHIIRNTQASKDELDKEETQGEYTTAWIGHGKAPENAGYEYVIKVQTTPEKMEQYDGKTYEVLQKDDNAHIIKHIPSNTTAYAVFKTDQPIEQGILASADTPVMVMIKEDGADKIVFSMSDPDLRLPKLPNQTMEEDTATTASIGKTTVVTLKGEWKLSGEQEGIRVVKSEGGQTVIELDCIDGQTREMVLTK